MSARNLTRRVRPIHIGVIGRDVLKEEEVRSGPFAAATRGTSSAIDHRSVEGFGLPDA
jgi:hypothetical protein